MAEWFRALDLKSGGPWFKSSTRYCYLDLFSVVPSSTPRPRCVNSQLVSLTPVGILNIVYVPFAIFSYLFTVSPISTTVLNTLDA